VRHVFAGIAVVAATLSLAGCSGSQTAVGVWTTPDGSSAFMNDDGGCSGMYFNNGEPLDIGGPMTCAYQDGVLVVSQPPNQVTYSVSFDGDNMTLTSGGIDVTLTRAN
jgi:hypothetical protein